MKKNDTTRHPRGASAGREVVRDWQPLFVRLQETIEWALDLAARLARDYDEDLEAIELDCGIDSSPLLAPLRSVASSMLHLPGAERDERATVVIRRRPRFRNAGSGFSHLAA